MKLKRQKKAKQIVKIYKTLFKFHAPYLVLVDGTFCQKAVDVNNIDVKDRISSYIDSEVICCTTKCILAELELLGPNFHHAKLIAQKFQLRHCEHKDKAIPAVDCIKSLLGDVSKGRFFVATQDKTLTKFVHSVPGTPLLYIEPHRNTVVLEKPSKKTEEAKEEISQSKLNVQVSSQVAKEQPKDVESSKRRKRKAKGPNPLSVKKKQKK